MFANFLLPYSDGAVLAVAALPLLVCLAATGMWLRGRRASQAAPNAASRDEPRPHHPRVLYLLALVQFWERFACFATLPLLVLYLEQQGMSTERALLLFGSLQALSYLSGLPGGYIGDRWLGARRATLAGTLLLACGYATLTRAQPVMLWIGFALLVAGFGLFKPGLYALVGRLYAEGDPQRERGFLILHVILNIGAAASPTLTEWARAHWGWGAIFQVATLGMCAGVASFMLAAPALRTGRRAAHVRPLAKSEPGAQRERIRACWLIGAVSAMLWLAGAQASTSLTLFAAQNTELHLRIARRSLTIAPGHFMSLHALLVLVLAPPLGWLLGRLERLGKGVSTPGKMIWGFVMSSAAFAVMLLAGLRGGDTARVGLSWLSACYVLLTLGELLLAPMGLALITRLAPPERTSRMVALWFAAMAVGNGLAGVLGLLWTRLPHHRYFALLALLTLGAAAVLIGKLACLERLLQTDRQS